MGCDIHLYTEKLITSNSNKEFWWCVDGFRLNEYKKLLEIDGDLKDAKAERDLYHISIFSDRDYDLFAALADVRNYGYIEPICDPRGLPDDLSDAVKKEAEEWSSDGHSHSWLTAKELFVYHNKHQHKTQSGLITEEQAKALDEKGVLPTAWCQWTSMKNYVWREWTVQQSPVYWLVEAVKAKMKEEFYIYDFLSEKEQEEKLWEHAEEFRIIFWFDS